MSLKAYVSPNKFLRSCSYSAMTSIMPIPVARPISCRIHWQSVPSLLCDVLSSGIWKSKVIIYYNKSPTISSPNLPHDVTPQNHRTHNHSPYQQAQYTRTCQPPPRTTSVWRWAGVPPARRTPYPPSTVPRRARCSTRRASPTYQL